MQMHKILLLTLSAATLFAFTPQARATEDAAPAKATVEGTAKAGDAAPASATPEQPAPVTEDNAATKTEAAPAEKARAEVQDAGAARIQMPEAAAEGETAPDEPTPITAVDEKKVAPEAAPAAEHEAASSDAHHVPQPPKMDWSWSGPMGTFDRPALQRGFQVYRQVCAACHSMNRVYFRNLTALGYNEAEIKSIAAESSITDGPNDEGEMFERPGRPSDHFKSPFANDQAARAANGGALPPDLSLIVRARADGSNYVHGILTGYTDVPAGFALNPGMHYNKYFAGHQIAMPAPLNEGIVTYDDGTAATVEQMSQDVTTFLTWASEPVMEKRKQTGLKVMLFLLVFSGLMYATKRRVWRNVH